MGKSPPEDLGELPTMSAEELAEHLAGAASPTIGASELSQEELNADADPLGEVSRWQPERYIVEGEIGRGGLGRVLLAFDAHVGRRIAIKELLPGMPGRGREADLRFLREARVTGQLEHPSILPVYEVGRRDDGSHYYAMRLVRGRSLARAIFEAGSLRERLHLLTHFYDLCNAVAYAHDRGVIHRDIKPDNVMIGEFGETVVLDWGLAKVLDEPAVEEPAGAAGVAQLSGVDGSRTQAGIAFGTPHYMSPEQARGDLARIDGVSDVYSLGAVLFEILTGRPPFDGSDAAEIVTRVVSEDAPPVVAIEPEAPRELAAIAEKALRRERELRYPDAGRLAQEVEAFMSGERVQAYDYGAVEMLRLFVRKHRAAVAAAVIVALALVVTAVAMSFSYAREKNARLSEAAARRHAEELSGKLEQAVEEETEQRLEAQLNLAQAFKEKALRMEREQRYSAARIYAAASLLNNPAFESSPFADPGFAASHPESLAPRADAASLIYRAAHHPSLRLVRVIGAPASEVFEAIAPAAGRLASIDDEGMIRVWDLNRGEPLLNISGHEGVIRSVAFSPDGTLLVSGGDDGTVRIWDARSGFARQVIRLAESTPRVVLFSPDGRRVAASDRQGGTHLYDAADGKPVASLAGRGSATFQMSWSPDGRHLAIAGWDKSLRIWPIDGGNPLELPAPPLGFHEAAFSPDSETLVTADWGESITLWSTRTWKPHTDLVGHLGAVYGFGFSKDGRRFVSGGFDRRVVLWDLASGERLLAIEPHGERIRELDFLPGGDRFVTLSWDHTARIWELAEGRPPLAALGHEQHVTSLACAPDGATFASGSWDSTVRLWNTRTGEGIGILEGHPGRIHSLTFSADGKRLASAGWDRNVHIWDPQSLKQVRVLPTHPERINGVTFSPDGTRIATIDSAGTLRIFDCSSGLELRAIDAHEVRAWNVQWSPDGARIATAAQDRKVKLWDPTSGELLFELEGHEDWVSGLAFSSDSRRLASSGKDGRLILWDLDSRKPVRRIEAHDVWANTVVIGKDDGLMVTSSDDRTVRVWSMATGEPLLILPGEEAVEAVQITPDGRSVLVGVDRGVVIYPLELEHLRGDPRRLLREAEQLVGLELRGFDAVPIQPASD